MSFDCLSYSCLISDGERCCCSGFCIQLPCWDDFAPNKAGCCCCAPTYYETEHDLTTFCNTILPNLRTGDVFLGSWPLEGESGTQLSRCMSHSRTSHVGLVYRPNDCPEILLHRDRTFPDKVDVSRPLLLHAIAGGECGARHAPEKGGVDIVDLETWIKDYLDKWSHSIHYDPEEKGVHRVAVRLLRGVNRDKEFYQAVESVVDRYWNTDFEASTNFNVMKSQISLCQCLPCCAWMRARPDDERLLCSELSGAVYKATGLVDSSLNLSEFVPAMWDSTRALRLREGVELTKEYSCSGPDSLQRRREMGYPELTTRALMSLELGPGGFCCVDVAQAIPQQQKMLDDEMFYGSVPRKLIQHQTRERYGVSAAPLLDRNEP